MRIQTLVLALLVSGCAVDVRLGDPSLPLDGPTIPITSGVEITQTGWAHFTRFCEEIFVEERGLGNAPIHQPRACEALSVTPLSANAHRISMRPTLPQAGQITVAFTRDNSGNVSNLEMFGAALGSVNPMRRHNAERILREVVNNFGLTRRSLMNGSPFTIYPPGEFGLFSELTIRCSTTGISSIKRRSVVVADCGSSQPASGQVPGTQMAFTGNVRGHFGIRVERLLSGVG
jgi:hypothetical protein